MEAPNTSFLSKPEDIKDDELVLFVADYKRGDKLIVLAHHQHADGARAWHWMKNELDLDCYPSDEPLMVIRL